MVWKAEIGLGMGACRRALWAVGLFSLALNLLMLTQPLYMTAIYDRVLSSRSEETLLMLTVVAVGALGMIGVLETVRQIVLMRTGARLEATLGGSVLDASLQAARRSEPDVQGLRDLAQLRQFISSPLVSVAFDAPVAPFYFALLYVIHPHLGWLFLGAAVVLILVSLLNERLTRAPLADSSRHAMTALQKAQAQARNAEAIRAMGMFSSCVASWGEDNARAMVAADMAGRRNAIVSGLSRFLRLLVQIAVLGYGAFLVLEDHALNAGIIFAASIISARALAPVDQAIGGWKSFVLAAQSYRRLKELLAAAHKPAEPMALPAPRASLTAERLVYAPALGTEPILKGLSFAIEPGEAVGIIGPSGAGKSTLARLLVGALKPSAGVVRIGGDDLQHWSSEALGPFMGYVPQDVELFPATVAQNIARMAGSPDPRKVVEAAQLANCHELIQRLPKGYDTLLGPQGQALSGGQRQRIALARAFYGGPRVVVLDEPNASLDGEGEQALTLALLQAQKAGMTCVVITQRTGIVRALSKIMVLKDGRIEAFGPRDEILQAQMRAASAPDAAQVVPPHPALQQALPEKPAVHSLQGQLAAFTTGARFG